MTEPSKFWWEATMGPRDLVDAVAQHLQQQRNVRLIVPEDLAWRRDLRAAVDQRLRLTSEMRGFSVDIIDVSDDCPTQDAGRYLLSRFARASVASGYRGRGTIQQYIAKQRVLDGRVLWIKGMNPEREAHWLQFCRGYAPGEECDVRFVLECHDDREQQEPKHVAMLRFGDRVKEHDLMLFNNNYVSENMPNLHPLWQQYVSVLCANLCDTDAETSVALMEALDVCGREPLAALLAVAERPEFARRGGGSERHILRLARRSASGDAADAAEAREAIDALIWEAQLQVFFPLLEVERMNFVRRYRAEIAAALQAEYVNFNTGERHRMKQFGETIESPEDAEWGALFFMNQHYLDLNGTQRMLALRDTASFYQLDRLHKMRNALAHGNCCPVEMIDRFIASYPYPW